MSKKYRFKSSTDVNNYNNFLLELDNKNKNANANANANILSDYVKDINKSFDNNGFNSLDKLTILCNAIDPNEYQRILDKDKCLDTSTSIIKPVIKPVIKPIIKPVIKNYINIQMEVNNIGDLLQLIELYPDDKETKYNINMTTLHKIKEPLIDLNNMIGMKCLKENIVDQILFYIQNLHNTNTNTDFMHTVIYGPPGTGKTEIAKIMGQIFAKIGILDKGTFKKVTRSDLVAGFLGQTAIKTKDVIKECLGGVLFIDEAYSLGSPEKRDSFSKECIDTLCEALSDHKDNLMVIIAGYETELNECFFNNNQGLNSRFTWRFKTDNYSAEDLYHIFIKKIKNAGWDLFIDNETINVKWFEKHKKSFKFYGRDIETLFAKVKIAHSRRVFCLDETIKKKITLKDMDKGLDMFLKNDTTENKNKENMQKVISSMYM